MSLRAILASTTAATAMAVSVHVIAPSPAIAASPNHEQIHYSGDQIYAESFSWSAKQKAFFVGSVRHGTIGKVSTDGKYVPFITDDKLVSSVGVLVDDGRDTLWVAIADPGFGDRSVAATRGKLAAVAAYDTRTGERRAYYDLSSLNPGAHFANDIALDKDGNVYVSDSFAPDLYRIGADGKTSVFAQDPAFWTSEGFNLNGIAWHPDGFLLVGKYNTGELFRVSTMDPSRVEKVQLPESIKGADGFHLVDGQHLVVVRNLGVDTAIELASTDGWKSAKVVRSHKSGMSMPTAATQVGNDVYVLDSRLDTLFDPKGMKVSDYLIEKF